LVLPEVVFEIEILVVEGDHSIEEWSDSPVIHTRNIIFGMVYSPDLLDENLRHQGEYLSSIWVLVLVDLVPEAAV